MEKIGIVGIGFMGSAIARALKSSGEPRKLAVVEKAPARRDWAVREFGALDYSATPEKLREWADLVVLAVKPQDLVVTASSIRETGKRSAVDAPVLSVLAGTSIARIADLLGTDQVIRIMPNLAADIGKAVAGVSVSPTLSGETRQAVLKAFSGLGTLIEIPEDNMAAITALSGSGIAFVCEFIEAMTLGAVKQGLPYPQALDAARDVVESAALLLRETGMQPREIVSRVCSPAGTTIAGMHALARGGLQAIVMDALEASADRSRELGA